MCCNYILADGAFSCKLGQIFILHYADEAAQMEDFTG